MKSSTLLISAILLFLYSISSKGESDTDGPSPPKKSALIKQCSCDEFFSCRAKGRNQFRECQESCVEKLDHPRWDAKEGRKCFAWKERSKTHECLEGMKRKTCTKEEGVMIPLSEAMRHHHHHHNHSHHADHHHKHHHNRHAFMNMVRGSFGVSGKEFISCMRDCYREGHRKHHCTKELHCALKRLPHAEWRVGVSKCHVGKLKERKELCNCLQNAGVKNVDCGLEKTVGIA